ncbi:hypothetical protein PUN71_014005 [Arthrobacter sp. NQ7]|uniref:hypothetical protein n=1 Tax=Arthrobacter sp. NQ7 TaxID=3032303 RepID=UPI00240F4DA9|nr:hypothetical protein [Arthrobacter sp. NQ7]MDJ0458314.1 hypothetical protein [Arthrobacter sp. NQ7]
MTVPLRAAQLPVKYERAEGSARHGQTIYEVAGSGLYQVTVAREEFAVSTLTQSGWTELITLDEGDGVSNVLEAMQIWLDIQTPTPPAGDSAVEQGGGADD